MIIVIITLEVDLEFHRICVQPVVKEKTTGGNTKSELCVLCEEVWQTSVSTVWSYSEKPSFLLWVVYVSRLFLTKHELMEHYCLTLPLPKCVCVSIHFELSTMCIYAWSRFKNKIGLHTSTTTSSSSKSQYLLSRLTDLTDVAALMESIFLFGQQFMY